MLKHVIRRSSSLLQDDHMDINYSTHVTFNLWRKLFFSHASTVNKDFKTCENFWWISVRVCVKQQQNYIKSYFYKLLNNSWSKTQVSLIQSYDQCFPDSLFLQWSELRVKLVCGFVKARQNNFSLLNTGAAGLPLPLSVNLFKLLCDFSVLKC